MKSITVSAPGKLMLFGDHAVVYNRPCLATSVGERMQTSIQGTDDDSFELVAPDIGIEGYKKSLRELGEGSIPKQTAFVEGAVKNFHEKYPLISGIKIKTKSSFSGKYGFGGSATSIVCTLFALNELYQKQLSQKELFDLSYKTVLDVQKVGSGFDVAAAIYGGILYYITGGSVIEPLSVKELPLVVCYSGVKGDTAQIIKEVKQKKELYPEKFEKLFDAVTQLVEQAKKSLLEKDWERVGKYMDFNQEYLRDLGVSTEKLESLISAAKKAGAWGAKLSGAGGGDCMIAFVSPDKRSTVEKALTEAGGEVIQVKTGVGGVKIE